MKSSAITGVVNHYLDERGQYDPRKSEMRKLELLHQRSLKYREKVVKEIFRKTSKT